MDIEHFEIIVKAMLSWSDEARPPRKTLGRHSAVKAPRDELDDDDDDENIDDDDDFEPDEEINIKPDSAEREDADLPVSEQAD